MNDIILSTQNGEPVVSSREVAKNFGKEHKDVLKAMPESKGMALTALIRGGMVRRRVAKELNGKAWCGEARRRIATEKLCIELQRLSKAERCVATAMR